MAFDHQFLNPPARGNRGAGLTLGWIEAKPGNSFHETRMRSWAARMCPDANLILRYANGANGHQAVGELASLGASVIAMPWVEPAGIASVAGWDQILPWASANGLLLCAAMGDGTTATGYPALLPCVYACGTSQPNGQSTSGKWDILWEAGDGQSSGAAMGAACCAIQWLGHAVFTNGPFQDRKYGFDSWLARPSQARGPRNSMVPFCGSL